MRHKLHLKNSLSTCPLQRGSRSGLDLQDLLHCISALQSHAGIVVPGPVRRTASMNTNLSEPYIGVLARRCVMCLFRKNRGICEEPSGMTFHVTVWRNSLLFSVPAGVAISAHVKTARRDQISDLPHATRCTSSHVDESRLSTLDCSLDMCCTRAELLRSGKYRIVLVALGSKHSFLSCQAFHESREAFVQVGRG